MIDKLLNDLLEETNSLEGRKAIVALAATTQRNLPEQVKRLQESAKNTAVNIDYQEVKKLLGDVAFMKIDDAADRQKQGQGFWRFWESDTDRAGISS